MERTIAAFDFDGTLTSRDSFVSFLLHTQGRRKTACAFLRFAPLVVLCKMGLCDSGRVKERMFARFFKGCSLARFESLGRQFAESHMHLLREDGRECLERHLRSDNTCVYVISASVKQWVAPFLPPKVRVLCTEPKTDSAGNLTGRFSTPNCRGEEKITRLLQAEPLRHTYRLVAYGDSSGDKPLLAWADESYFKPFKSSSR